MQKSRILTICLTLIHLLEVSPRSFELDPRDRISITINGDSSEDSNSTSSESMEMMFQQSPTASIFSLPVGIGDFVNGIIVFAERLLNYIRGSLSDANSLVITIVDFVAYLLTMPVNEVLSTIGKWILNVILFIPNLVVLIAPRFLGDPIVDLEDHFGRCYNTSEHPLWLGLIDGIGQCVNSEVGGQIVAFDNLVEAIRDLGTTIQYRLGPWINSTGFFDTTDLVMGMLVGEVRDVANVVVVIFLRIVHMIITFIFGTAVCLGTAVLWNPPADLIDEIFDFIDCLI